MLNACEGATSSGVDLYSSTASITASRRGLPSSSGHAVCNHGRASIELSRTFYEAMADGMPVDAALAEARKAISLELENSLEWGTPVLHLRAPDGVLFQCASQATKPRPTCSRTTGQKAGRVSASEPGQAAGNPSPGSNCDPSERTQAYADRKDGGAIPADDEPGPNTYRSHPGGR